MKAYKALAQCWMKHAYEQLIKPIGRIIRTYNGKPEHATEQCHHDGKAPETMCKDAIELHIERQPPAFVALLHHLATYFFSLCINILHPLVVKIAAYLQQNIFCKGIQLRGAKAFLHASIALYQSESNPFGVGYVGMYLLNVIGQRFDFLCSACWQTCCAMRSADVLVCHHFMNHSQ